MHTAFLSSWDTLIVMAPIVGLMALGMFGLDGMMVAPRSERKHPREFCGATQNGRQELSDPDGRAWTASPRHMRRSRAGVRAVDTMRVAEILAELRQDRERAVS